MNFKFLFRNRKTDYQTFRSTFSGTGLLKNKFHDKCASNWKQGRYIPVIYANIGWLVRWSIFLPFRHTGISNEMKPVFCSEKNQRNKKFQFCIFFLFWLYQEYIQSSIKLQLYGPTPLGTEDPRFYQNQTFWIKSSSSMIIETLVQVWKRSQMYHTAHSQTGFSLETNLVLFWSIIYSLYEMSYSQSWVDFYAVFTWATLSFLVQPAIRYICKRPLNTKGNQ
jgi:hypothetical protein